MHDFIGAQGSRDSHSPMDNMCHTKANNPHEACAESPERQWQASSGDEVRDIGPRVKCACQVQ
jgi:hypothetical protein